MRHGWWTNDPDGALLDAKKRADNPQYCRGDCCKNVRQTNRHRTSKGMTQGELHQKEALEDANAPEN